MKQIPNIEEEVARIDGANVSGGDIHSGLHNAINHVFFALEADEFDVARNEVFAEVRGIVTTLLHQQLQKARKEERERIEAVFKEYVPPHAMDLEDSVWLKRLLNKAFNHDKNI